MYQRVDELIGNIVKDKSFVDVGPCFGTIYEKLSVAHFRGAKSLTAIDTYPEDCYLWLHLRRRLHNIPCTYHSMNVMDYNGNFDVVYCSGVIYHQPDPFTFMDKLYKLTDEHLVLKSTITDTHINGKLFVPDGGCIFLPGVDEKTREIIAEDWKSFLSNCEAVLGLNAPHGEWTKNCWDWWWLFTEGFLVSLCKVTGFQVVSHEKIGKEVLIHCRKGQKFVPVNYHLMPL